MSSCRTPPTDLPAVVDTSISGRFVQFSDSKEYDCNEYGNIDIPASPSATSIPSPTASHAEVVAHAQNLLSRIPPKNHDSKKKLRSPASEEAVVRTELSADDNSHVSSPTVSCCGTFSDDDFSMCSTEDLLAQAKNRIRQPNPTSFEHDDLLSVSSSLNSHRQRQISGLRKKLHTSEMTKLQLLTQCADLWGKIEKDNCDNARLKEYRQQNVILRDDTATMERDFMNEVSKLVHEMTLMNKKYTDMIVDRDNRIADMEMEIEQLKDPDGVNRDLSTE